jgi:hypothetical protein
MTVNKQSAVGVCSRSRAACEAAWQRSSIFFLQTVVLWSRAPVTTAGTQDFGQPCPGQALRVGNWAVVLWVSERTHNDSVLDDETGAILASLAVRRAILGDF